MKSTTTKINQKTSKAEKAIAQVKKIITQLDEADKATLALLLDKEAQKNIARSREEIKRGEFMTLEEFKKM